MAVIEDEMVGADGTLLYAWRSEHSNPRAEIVLVHGFGEHSGRYAALTERLNSRGYSVNAFDQRGHGRSGGLQGHIDRFSDYADDLSTMVSRLRSRTGAKKTFLIGHSMGGLVVLGHLAGDRGEIAGAALSAPLFGLAVKPPPFRLAIGKVAAVLAPRMRLGNGINPDVLSRDPEVGLAYSNDRFVGRLVSANWFAQAMKAMKEVTTLASKINAPILIMHGTEDKLADVEATKYAFGALNSDDKELVIYDGFYHELFNEPEKAQVFDRVISWLDLHST